MDNRFEKEHPHGRSNEVSDKFQKHVLEGGCPVSAHEEVDVTVPAFVRANAEIGRVSLRCIESRIVKNSNEVYGRVHYHPEAISRFTISQKLRVDIPVKFAVEAFVGEGHVHFNPTVEPFGEHFEGQHHHPHLDC